MALCPFCSKDVAAIKISALNLRVCPGCFSTFLPAKQFSALRRELNKPTRSIWKRVLEKHIENPVHAKEDVCCIDCNRPLVKGEIPDYGYKGLIPTCCDIQHLRPAEMVKILQFGLEMEDSSSPGFGSLATSRKKPRGVAAFLGGIIFRWWEKRNPQTEDCLELLQYEFKFKEVLGMPENSEPN